MTKTRERLGSSREGLKTRTTRLASPWVRPDLVGQNIRHLGVEFVGVCIENV